MILSKHFPSITKEEEDAYLEDKMLANLNGYAEWKKSIPSYTLFQALSVFPEAKPLVKQKLKEELREIAAQRKSIDEFYRKTTETEPSYRTVQETEEYCRRQYDENDNKEKRLRFNLARLNGKTPKGEIGSAEIAKAKELSLGELLPFNSAGFVKCIFHNEKNGSMKWYKKENRFTCFGCNKHGDSVDIVMKLQSCDFISAVKKLIQL